MIIKKGDQSDLPEVLALLDDAAQWLVDLGRTGQWGTEKQSTQPRRIAQAQKWADSGGLYLACIDDTAVGVLAVGEAPAHIPPAPEPELYINFLVTDRAHAGQGIGARLLERAADLARERGVGLLRVDCYAGDDRALVRYYERQGFTPTDSFVLPMPRGQRLAGRAPRVASHAPELWRGAVLSRRV